MERKNLGQKIVIERFFSSLILGFQRVLYSTFIGAIVYILFFNYFIGLKYFFIPINYYFHKIMLFILPYLYNIEDDFFSSFFRKIFNYKRIYYNYSIYSEMQNLINKYFLISAFTSLAISVSFFIFITKYFNKKGKILNEGRHYRGLKLVTKKEFDKEIKTVIKSNETGLSYTKKDLYIGKEKIRIPSNIGANMWSCLGNAGTGKSQTIFSMLLQISQFGDKVIIVDPAGEYFKYFGKKDDIILSLYDVRSEYYSFWNEGFSSLKIAQSLIEDMDGGNVFWSKAGQALFAAMMELSTNSEEMYNLLFLKYDELKDKLINKKLAAGIVLGEAEQAGGVLSTAAVDLVWLLDMNYWPKKCGKKEAFSINKWVKNNSDKRWVFLTCSDKNWTTSKHLIRLWTDIAIYSAFERGVSKDNIPIWLVCDELSSIGKLPSMSLLEDRGRKYNLGLIVGYHTPSQLEVIYGKAKTKVIMQGLQNQILFRSNEQEMLEYMSQQCGEAEYIQTNSSSTFGVKNSESISDNIIRKRNVLPDEFKDLKNMNAYLKVSGHNPVRIKIQRIQLPEKNIAEASYIPNLDKWDGFLNGVKLIKDDEKEENTLVESLENNIADTLKLEPLIHNDLNDAVQNIEKIIVNTSELNDNVNCEVISENTNEIQKINNEIILEENDKNRLNFNNLGF